MESKMTAMEELIANKANMTDEEIDRAIDELSKGGFGYEWLVYSLIIRHGMDFRGYEVEFHMAADRDKVRMDEIYRRGREDERNGIPDRTPKEYAVFDWRSAYANRNNKKANGKQ